MSTCPLMCLDGRILPYEQAQVHAFSAVVKYGLGVFEGLRAYWNAEQQQLHVFRLAEHLDRLAYGMRVMRFERVIPAEELADALLRTLHANEIRENVHIRLIAYIAGDGDLHVTGPVGYTIGLVKRPPGKALETGIHVAVSAWQRLADNAMPPRVKCTANYVNNRAAEITARQDGYQGVLMLSADGKLSEASGACVFLVRKGRLVTPDASSDILESITRDTVIELAREQLGLPVEERRVDRSELWAADEVFWCGSGQEVVPILSVDRLPVGDGRPGPVTRRVQRAYFDEVYGRSDQHTQWLTPVWPR